MEPTLAGLSRRGICFLKDMKSLTHGMVPKRSGGQLPGTGHHAPSCGAPGWRWGHPRRSWCLRGMTTETRLALGLPPPSGSVSVPASAPPSSLRAGVTSLRMRVPPWGSPCVTPHPLSGRRRGWKGAIGRRKGQWLFPFKQRLCRLGHLLPH